jgi:hypothetical protein
VGPVTIKFTVQVNEYVHNGHHGAALFNSDRQLVWAWAGEKLRLDIGKHYFCYTFPMLPLRPGPYSWQVSLYEDADCVDAWDCLPEMTIAAENHQHQYDQWNGLLNIPTRFEHTA